LFQPEQNAEIAAKRFIGFSQSQRVSTHVIVPPQPLAWRANSKYIATVIC